jgi:hypothetical protein
MPGLVQLEQPVDERHHVGAANDPGSPTVPDYDSSSDANDQEAGTSLNCLVGKAILKRSAIFEALLAAVNWAAD